MLKQSLPLASILVSFFFAAPIYAQSADPTAEASDPSADVRELTGAHTRMVWMQDGEPTPHPWGGVKMRLIVLDTDDGKGIHPLFPAPAGYSWPYMTPDGKGIVFNFLNHPENAANTSQCVKYINWDGTGLRDVLPPDQSDGIYDWCTCVVQDPATAFIWVYCDTFSGGSTVTTRHFNGSKRFRLDNPSISEPVYDHYLGRACASPDGKIIAGVYEAEGGAPTGVYDIPNATWHPIGQGCQPYVLPCVNPYRYWLCDGGHHGGRIFTNPTIPDQMTAQHIDLRGAPNAGSHEVRYPHWSNDIHIMALDSPYLDKEKQYQKTEICLARFDENLTKVEKYLQVTHNNVGDYFASTWVDNGGSTPVSPSAAAARPSATANPTAAAAASAAPASAIAEPKANATPSVAAPASAWPGDKKDLVYLWENSSAGNEIIDPAGKHSLCVPNARDGAIFGRYGEMDLSGGSFYAKPESTAAMLAACKQSGAFSIEATIHPDRLDQSQPGSIVSFSAGSVCNFSLGMVANNLVMHLRTSQNPADSAINVGDISDAAPQHVIVTFQKGLITSYLNGSLAAVNGSIRGDLQVWTPASLIFGDDDAGGHNWPGTLEGIAIYSRALNAEEAAAHDAAYSLRLAKRQKPTPPIEVSAKLYDITSNSTPASILPYHRLLVVDSYEVVSVVKGTCDAKKISVAHWAILDDRVLALDREKGKTYDLVLESMADNPQLESECTHNESTDVTLPLYYEVDRHLDKLGPKPAE